MNIEDLITQRRITTYFQPIVSARTKATIGLEALSRAICPESGQVIPFPNIMEKAVEDGLTVELDRLCRERAVENFSAIKDKHDDLLLFLNLHTSIIDKGVVGSGHLINLVRQLNIRPENVVIEILEANVKDTDALRRFAQTHREYGFLLAVDDMGIGSSNLDRTMQLKPDIIKVDRALIKNIDQDNYKQEIFKSLIGLSRKVGALVVAEGIESEDEALVSLELGADLLQGYYFLRPQIINSDTIKSCAIKIESIANKYKNARIKTIRHEQETLKFYNQIMNTVIVELSRVSQAAFETKLKKYVNLFPSLEYLYILDMAGKQVTDSICCSEKCFRNERKIYRAGKFGADQSLKDYYLYIKAGVEKYVSRPYMSLASGNLCITSSASFHDRHGHGYILCADFNP
ncbi:EAL domain-containing protein [Dendrosporobacter sp. 1207_IL3150]|uniref:EAL domain-containing protein n=1 Tax=Dendrosporobacter sp. 1207_IL3150 TaxID=3084054 RepID=UPI002FD8F5C9